MWLAALCSDDPDTVYAYNVNNITLLIYNALTQVTVYRADPIITLDDVCQAIMRYGLTNCQIK